MGEVTHDEIGEVIETSKRWFWVLLSLIGTIVFGYVALFLDTSEQIESWAIKFSAISLMLFILAIVPFDTRKKMKSEGSVL